MLGGLGFAFYAGVVLYAAHHYKEYVAQLPPPYRPVVEGERLAKLRQEIRAKKWCMLGSTDGQSNETAIGEVLASLGYSVSMESVQTVFCEELPAFDYLNVRSMAQPAALAYVRAALMLGSDDGVFYLNADKTVAVIFYQDNLVSYVRVENGEIYTGSIFHVENFTAPPADSRFSAPSTHEYSTVPFEL